MEYQHEHLFNKNKVLALNQDNDPIYSGNNDGRPTNITMVGKPIGQFSDS